MQSECNNTSAFICSLAQIQIEFKVNNQSTKSVLSVPNQMLNEIADMGTWTTKIPFPIHPGEEKTGLASGVSHVLILLALNVVCEFN